MPRKLTALSRRTFLSGISTWAALGRAAESPPASVLYRREPPPIASAADVFDVMGFEPLAQAALPPAHYGYIATGVDDNLTVARNHDAFGHYEIRARRFVDLTHLDTSCSVLGEAWATPLYLSAVSGMRAFHPDAEIAVGRAARSRKVRLMLSSGSSAPPADVAAAAGQALWQQIYPTDDWQVTRAMVQRAQEQGAAAIVLTVDAAATPRNNETLKRAMLADSRDCRACHKDNRHDMWLRAPLFSGLDVSRVTSLAPPDLTPAWLDKLRREVRVRLIVKGIVTGEDARLAVEHGADGVVVSNHGGRNEETLRATIDCVPEVASAVRGRVPVLVDGGIRRGTDVFKALALGASGVGIGRPQAWGLAAFGQPGVEAVLDILQRELQAIMRQAGTPSLKAISAAHLVRANG
ncbi:MAG: alpha-hydroxy-acid oxidizing protein [Proteobacteria bacterium]|nr:alpha-hydroxy-acid oxidizing protein [Pseudomonadota bacterium]